MGATGACPGYTYQCTITSVKRRELERRLQELGWRLLRHGGKHDIWTDGALEEPVPRHSEVNEKLARKILRKAGDRK